MRFLMAVHLSWKCFRTLMTSRGAHIEAHAIHASGVTRAMILVAYGRNAWQLHSFAMQFKADHEEPHHSGSGV
jgi:hypothetical protein